MPTNPTKPADDDEPLDWSEVPAHVGTYWERTLWAMGWNAAKADHVPGCTCWSPDAYEPAKHCDFAECVLPYGHVESCRVEAALQATWSPSAPYEEF